MKYEKSKISTKSDKPKPPKTIKDIEDTLKEMDKIHNTSFFNWIKDENNASVIAFKTKDLFQENYEKQPELVYNALRFLCKDWKLSKIAELILKLFYNSNVASEKLAIIIYEVSLLLENPEKVDLISLLLIGEEPKNVAFFLYHFFKYTEKKYREHTEILNEEEFLDEINGFCSGILECLFSCLKWSNDYFRELIIEYVTLSTLEIDARREFLIRMVNIKYSRFQEEMENRKENIKSNDYSHENKNNSAFNIPRKNSIEKIEETEEVFRKSLNFGILIFNMYQVVMRTEVDDLLAVTSPTSKEIPSNSELTRDKTIEMNDLELSDDILSDNSFDYCSSKRISLKMNDDDEGVAKNHEGNHMKKDESSATLWMDDENENYDINTNNTDNINENFDNSEMSISKDYSISSIYNFGYDSSFCKNDTTSNEQEDPTTSDNSEFSYHFEELFNESIIIGNHEEVEEADLLDDFINKSFTSNTPNRRNSMLSLCSFINDHSLEENNSIRNINNDYNNNNNSESHSSSSSRCNSRYSLNLSIHTMPCLDDNSSISSHCGCNCTRYNNYSDNLLYVFPSPTSSPTLPTPPASPNFLLNDHYDSSENVCTNGKCNHSPEIGEDDYSVHNNSCTNLNDSCCQSLSTTLVSPTMTNINPNISHCQFSPELLSPSPIVQSLSVDNVYINSYGYSCTFNHVNSTPILQSTQTAASNQHDKIN
ncbi:hypothetical protein BCR36DRAFT_414267 [Piromyces finnis]|uniref:Uncharacterized protein n=1 Tax=Piromyces finnis TaxID=1754191 RepID=A0A1Y1V2R3_9FUNG|nr:hypothetical protein BCR36DRAFT_414267 [Piromyces finnis]|eukprot:ORX45953.1 hypothetical protein BCR36DRAFT_414267 [Piromyces finnis]